MNGRAANGLRELAGVARSLRIYYAHPGQARRTRAFYAQFVGAGDLAFDVGAHVGSRVRAWRGLGARVVAVEPLPACTRLLRRCYGRDRQVCLVEEAVGAAPGRQPMLVSLREPTVSTLSTEWAAKMRQRRSFARTRWNTTIEVPVTTLDRLIARFGEPVFCKIDVEGSEPAVLDGLSRPLRCLSFEYVPGAIDQAVACVERLPRLGAYQFMPSSGESMRLAWPQWGDPARLTAWLDALDLDDLPGDVYARLHRRP